MNQLLPRVGFVGLETYSALGGIQQFNQRVIRHLADLYASAPERVRILTLRDTPDDLPELDISMQALPSRMRLQGALLSAADRLDILLIGQINLLPAAWLAKLRNPQLRLILFVHGVEVWNNALWRRRRFYEPWLLNAVYKIASVSAYTAQVMAREFLVKHERFTLFPNAIDIPLNSPVPQLRDNSSTILVVTRLSAGERQKHVDWVIRGFAKVLSSFPDARLEIVGSGVLKDEYVALALSLGIDDRVMFLGRISDLELASAYDRARLFALPSTKEGFGIVYLEAWRAGLPVLCSDHGAPAEIVEDGVDGWHVDASDENAIAKAMLEALTDIQAAKARGLAGYHKARDDYSDARMRERLRVLLLS